LARGPRGRSKGCQARRSLRHRRTDRAVTSASDLPLAGRPRRGDPATPGQAERGERRRLAAPCPCGGGRSSRSASRSRARLSELPARAGASSHGAAESTRPQKGMAPLRSATVSRPSMASHSRVPGSWLAARPSSGAGPFARRCWLGGRPRDAAGKPAWRATLAGVATTFRPHCAAAPDWRRWSGRKAQRPAPRPIVARARAGKSHAAFVDEGPLSSDLGRASVYGDEGLATSDVARPVYLLHVVNHSIVLTPQDIFSSFDANPSVRI
jgi:hypothetical protein